jgi:hypothetical protein
MRTRTKVVYLWKIVRSFCCGIDEIHLFTELLTYLLEANGKHRKELCAVEKQGQKRNSRQLGWHCIVESMH